MTTVARNPIPRASAVSLRRFLSMTMSARYGIEDKRSSEAISRTIAVTASQRPTSDTVRGNLTFLNLPKD